MSRTQFGSPVRVSIGESLLKNRLGTLTVSVFVLSAAAPVTVAAGVIPTGFATTNIIGQSLAFVAVGIVLAIFSVGYNAMSRRISNAGAFYAYVSQGLGRPLGVASAVGAALAYTLLQVGLYGVFGIAVTPLLNPIFGVDIPWAVWAIVAWAVVAFLGFRRVDLNGRILAVLMALEIILVLIFGGANAANPAGGEVSFASFSPAELFVPGVGALFVIAITGFVGFEASAIFSEEARDPARTVPRATLLCIAVIAVLYAIVSWSMTVTAGPDQIGAVAARDGGETLFNMASANLGSEWSTIGHVLFATSVFAAMISYHNFVGRYMYALGREGVLPAIFSKTTHSGAPKWGSAFQSATGLIVIIVFAAAGLDPLVQLFFWGGTTGAFGVLLLLTLTSIAVIGYQIRHRHETVWRGFIAPAIGLLALLFFVTTAVLNFDTLLGVPPDSSLRWTLPGLYLVTAAIGLAWAFIIKRNRPDVYRTIGLGADSTARRPIPGAESAPELSSGPR
jgi:amino acid transporter